MTTNTDESTNPSQVVLREPTKLMTFDILVDGLDPIIESLDLFDDRLSEMLRNPEWAHSLYIRQEIASASNWYEWSDRRIVESGDTPEIVLSRSWYEILDIHDIGICSRLEHVCLWLTAHHRRSDAVDFKTQLTSLRSLLGKWQIYAGAIVRKNEHEIHDLKQIPGSNGEAWPEEKAPSVIDYVDEQVRDSLADIFSCLFSVSRFLKNLRVAVGSQDRSNGQNTRRKAKGIAQSKRPSRRRFSECDIYFLKLQKDGKSAKEIAGIWNNKNPRDNVTYDAVKKAISRLKRDKS